MIPYCFSEEKIIYYFLTQIIYIYNYATDNFNKNMIFIFFVAHVSMDIH